MTPRSAAANRLLREEARTRIFDGSIAVFSERGFAHASIDAIARRAGVSKGLVYHYFDSKADLLVTALRWRIRTLLALTDEIASIEGPRARLTALAKGILASVEADPDFYRFYLGLTLGTPAEELEDGLERIAQPLERYMSRVHDDFRAAGSPDPAVDALLFRSTLLGLAVRVAARDPAAAVPALADQVVRRFVPAGDGLA